MILSLDCSSTAIGWALFDEDDLVSYGRLKPTDSDADWKDRTSDLCRQLFTLINDTKPSVIYQEQVPMTATGQGGAQTLAKLYYVQGATRVIECDMCNVPVHYIEVGTWRKNLGINTGKNQHRDAKKIKSIKKANELFDISLPLVYTKSGNYSEKKSNDDTADAINLYCSTRKKYRPCAFIKGVK